MSQGAQPGRSALGMVAAAWLATSVFYFYQYILRSAPSVMVPEMSLGFGLTPVGVASLLGLFYYAYAPFSLVAGVAMDQFSPRKIVPVGAAVVALGALLFSTGDPTMAGFGRFLQGAGGVFALIGAVYIASSHLPAARAATLIGATQMFGMAGGSAGQFVVGPLIAGGLEWDRFWLLMGLVGLPLAVLLFVLIPSQGPKQAAGGSEGRLQQAGRAMKTVFINPQSILCGVIAGLLFIPTTIFDMVWGVRFLEEAHDLPYSVAVLRSASVPFGWIIGCPLLGWLSDRLGRRKPVIVGSAAVLFGSLALILYGPPGLLPSYSLGLVAGIASGAAMIPYTVIKEANRPEHSGTATGVINFINFSISALLGPVFAGMLIRASGGGERDLEHYQATFQPMLWGVALAIVLTLLLRETGSAARPVAAPPRPTPQTQP
ncbi:MFS transporter [Croceibacterium sp. LX-88]|uniref:MFS transporter n=1 Tax=Croceibacterium selenioxidans TaxID=2838833 RepID=A0ABS5W1K8_9SPHN|nr:MFS transporter [Croceibacterium selenioxidans]MBT2133643.1 MFS transporter [Croceibacterium selenioxidans]